MKKSEKGLSLVELVMAIAITGIIVGFLGTAIYQILLSSEYGNGRLTAMHELQNAAHWFSLDVQQATNASTGGGLSLTLSDNSSVTYSLAGTELRRTAGGIQKIVARNITSANFSMANRVITMSLTSSPVGRDSVSESGTYQVYLRPSEGSG